MYNTLLRLSGAILMASTCLAQNQTDSIRAPIDSTEIFQQGDNTPDPTYTTNLFKAFSGSLNAIYNDTETKGSFDLSVQTYHFFLVTGRRNKNDSIHSARVHENRSVKALYNGVHFFLLNRAALDFDTLKSIANSYITSLQASPFTLRIKKEFFLTKQHGINSSSYAPVVSLITIGDGRAIPFGNAHSKVSMGVSGHFYLTFSALFKRIEYNAKGKIIDKGTMYFRPSFGISYGTQEMMRSVLISRKNTPLFSSQCKLGFNSEHQKIKDFSFLFQYTMTQVRGPQVRAGIILRSFD